MDTVDCIEQLIVPGSEGFFDEPDIRKDLHVTIRIARDFYDFLVKFGDQPPAREIEYVMGTIRSGMDGVFALAYLCRTITGSETWSFDQHLTWDFPALRERFLRSFEHLAGTSDAGAGLSSLLSLTHLEFVFLAQHFPFVILREVAGTSHPTGSTGKAGSRS